MRLCDFNDIEKLVCKLDQLDLLQHRAKIAEELESYGVKTT